MNQTTSAYQSISPLGVEADEAAGQLYINWNDGHTTRHGIEWLRWNCPCALCKGEMGLPGRLESVTELKPDETALQDVQPIGRYGLMMFWADGHHDGIFTYDLLRQTCQCDDCVSARTQSQTDDSAARG